MVYDKFEGLAQKVMTSFHELDSFFHAPLACKTHKLLDAFLAVGFLLSPGQKCPLLLQKAYQNLEA